MTASVYTYYKIILTFKGNYIKINVNYHSQYFPKLFNDK
jgi:hypothetical protein